MFYSKNVNPMQANEKIIYLVTNQSSSLASLPNAVQLLAVTIQVIVAMKTGPHGIFSTVISLQQFTESRYYLIIMEDTGK